MFNKGLKISYWWTIFVSIFLGVALAQVVLTEPMDVISIKGLVLLVAISLLALAINTFYRKSKG